MSLPFIDFMIRRRISQAASRPSPDPGHSTVTRDGPNPERSEPTRNGPDPARSAPTLD